MLILFPSPENETVSKKCLCEPFSDFPPRPKLLHLCNVANPPNWQGFETTPFIFSKKFQIRAEDKVLNCIVVPIQSTALPVTLEKNTLHFKVLAFQHFLTLLLLFLLVFFYHIIADMLIQIKTLSNEMLYLCTAVNNLDILVWPMFSALFSIFSVLSATEKYS